jgi:hypothetical protein
MSSTSPGSAAKRRHALRSVSLKNCTMLDSSPSSITRIQVMPLAPKPGTISLAYSFCSTFLLNRSDWPLTLMPLMHPPRSRICLKMP